MAVGGDYTLRQKKDGAAQASLARLPRAVLA
jgi:hypothetical protein